MPHINAAAALLISVLLFALPVQYFISQWYRTDSAKHIQIAERNWYYGENKTKSDCNEAKLHSYFAESTHVHSPKPEYIKFCVGQVIIHRRSGYSGAIVGWDVKANTPQEQLHPRYSPVKQDLKDTPHYRILINKANRFGKSTAYVPEEEITVMGLEPPTVIQNMPTCLSLGAETMLFQVYHPDMETYFSGYDGSKYIMQPWLKKLYPHD